MFSVFTVNQTHNLWCIYGNNLRIPTSLLFQNRCLYQRICSAFIFYLLYVNSFLEKKNQNQSKLGKKFKKREIWTSQEKPNRCIPFLWMHLDKPLAMCLVKALLTRMTASVLSSWTPFSLVVPPTGVWARLVLLPFWNANLCLTGLL